MAISTNNGLVNGLVHNLLDNSKIEVFSTYSYDIVTTSYDHPRYIKHVLGRIYVVSTLFGYQVQGRGVSQGIGTHTACAVFHLGVLKMEVFQNLFF